jgi:ABC-type uncharacterized transport system permease subunit
MALEPIVFGFALTVISIGNHLFYSDRIESDSMKRAAAHTEYGFGSIVLFFAAPFSATTFTAIVYFLVAIGFYIFMTKVALQTNQISIRSQM